MGILGGIKSGQHINSFFMMLLSFIITNDNLPYKFFDKFNISGNNFGSLQNSSQTSELAMESKFLEKKFKSYLNEVIFG